MAITTHRISVYNALATRHLARVRRQRLIVKIAETTMYSQRGRVELVRLAATLTKTAIVWHALLASRRISVTTLASTGAGQYANPA